MIELGGYLFISPFPAVRRLLSLFVAATVLFGRVATRRGIAPEKLRLIRGLSTAGVLLGLGYYAVDLHDAEAEQEAFHRAIAFVRQRDPCAHIRFYGTWGTVTCAEREGLEWTRNVGEDLRPGEWFIHDSRNGLPICPSVRPYLVVIERILVRDTFPLSTQGCFYSSRTPIVHFEGPRMEMCVYRYWPE